MRLISQDRKTDINYNDYALTVETKKKMGNDDRYIIYAVSDFHSDILHTMGVYNTENCALDVMENAREMYMCTEGKNVWFEFPQA